MEKKLQLLRAVTVERAGKYSYTRWSNTPDWLAVNKLAGIDGKIVVFSTRPVGTPNLLAPTHPPTPHQTNLSSPRGFSGAAAQTSTNVVQSRATS